MHNLKNCIKEKVQKTLNITNYNLSDLEVLDIIEENIQEESHKNIISIEDRISMKDAIFHDIRGFGLIDTLLKDDGITEIMINGNSYIFIEKNGRIEKIKEKIETKSELEEIVFRIASKTNKTINLKSPILDTHLEDGSRINIVLPPIAKNGPIITIRRFYNIPLTMEKLIEKKTLTSVAANFLKKLVENKKSIFISGGTGAGKTTLLNALSNYIPKDERIITIEDCLELSLQGVKNLVSLEARSGYLNKENQVSIRDLIRTSLRMRPDRIVVGEVRGEETIDMLSAMNTGHSGSLSTGHGNSAKDMFTRMETMFLMGMSIPIEAIRRQIASAIEYIVHISRLKDGTRKVVEISKVLGVEKGEIKMKQYFIFEERGIKDGKVVGELRKCD